MDFKIALNVFENYVKGYNIEKRKIKIKYYHTLEVVKLSENIAKDLDLKNEDIELAKLIALLHDIGRFEQAKRYNSFVDTEKFDHANYAIDLLFGKELIKKFIKSRRFDNIIKKAIWNHNKYNIEDGLSERELLHAKIIRDADKVDILKMNSMLKPPKSKRNLYLLENDEISDKIFNDFKSKKSIINSERVTYLDRTASVIAFVFDFNFDYGLKVVKEKKYLSKIINKIEYKNSDTQTRMNVIKKIASEYLDGRLNNN